MEIPYTISTRPDTGLWNAKIGIWLFLASEVMLFGGLFSAYIFLRIDAPPGMWPHGLLNVPVGTMNTAILILSSVTVVLAWASLKMRKYRAYWWYMLATITCGVIFLTVKLAYEWPQKFDHFGAYIKTEALGKYEQYLGNEYAAEKGLPPRLEITGHLHNHAALHDPNIKEY
jgi:cytochrome c oxidase subunit 3